MGGKVYLSNSSFSEFMIVLKWFLERNAFKCRNLGLEPELSNCYLRIVYLILHSLNQRNRLIICDFMDVCNLRIEYLILLLLNQSNLLNDL